MSDTRTMTLTDFLLARIAEDELWVEGGRALGGGAVLWDEESIARAEAECEAKRRIVQRTSPDFGPNAAFEPSPIVEWIIRTLALPYADHPDYRDEWRP